MFRYTCSILLLVTAAALPALSLADITVTQRLSTNGFGPLALGAMDGTSETAIAGDRARIESDMHFKSGFLRMVARHAGESIQLIRLDEGLVDQIDARAKTYRESSFEDFRAATQKTNDDVQAAQRQQSTGTAAMDDSTCDWQAPETTVTRSGEHATIAGVASEQVAVRRAQACVDKRSGQRCSFVFQMEEWMAADLPGQREQREFWKAYAKQLGAGDMTSPGSQGAQTILGRYQDSWKELATKAAALKGYPVKTIMTMHVSGEGCESGQPSSGSNATDPQAALMGILGKFRKSPDPAAPSQDGVELFRMTTETISISTTPIVAERLQVPAGYKIKK